MVSRQGVVEHAHTNYRPPSRNQLRIVWFALTALAIAVIVVVTVGFIWGFGLFLNLLSPVLWPLAIAAVLSYLLDPAVNWLERRKISRPWAIVIVFLGMLCVVVGILASVIPQLVQETNSLVSEIPRYTARAQQKIENWADKATSNAGQENTNSSAQTNTVTATETPKSKTQKNSTTATNLQNDSSTNSAASAQNEQQMHKQIVTSAKNWISQVMPKIGNWALNLLSKATSLVDVVVALILIPIYTFYFLREKREIKRQWTNYLPIRDSHIKNELVYMLSATNQYLIAFFRGQVLVALISGALYTISFLSLGLDYALLLGFVAVILVIVPFVGAIILLILAFILTIVQFHDLFHPMMILFVFAVVQSLESFFYSPRIMGNRVNLHPVVVIIALMVGITLLGGLLGGILAIPLAAALRVALFRYVWKKGESLGSKI